MFWHLYWLAILHWCDLWYCSTMSVWSCWRYIVLSTVYKIIIQTTLYYYEKVEQIPFRVRSIHENNAPGVWSGLIHRTGLIIQSSIYGHKIFGDFGVYIPLVFIVLQQLYVVQSDWLFQTSLVTISLHNGCILYVLKVVLVAWPPPSIYDRC